MSFSRDDLSIRGAACVLVAGITAAGALLGGAYLAAPKVQAYTAYNFTTDSTLKQMGDEALGAVLSARSSFVLGATTNIDKADPSEVYHRIVVIDDEISKEYYDAGVAWQDEVNLPDDVLIEMSRKVAEENDEIQKIQRDFVERLQPHFRMAYDANILVSIATLRGIMDVARDLIEIDERIIARTDKFLSKAPKEALDGLSMVRAKASLAVMTEATGNDKLFATLQNKINAMPRDLTIFGDSGGSHKRRRSGGGLGILPDRLDTDENLSTVPVVETASLELDPQLHGIHEEGP